ncbi:hypothetical protein ACFFIX_16190 [Metabacillus herbersteinensis]|uniref:YobI-like P-loop NTPase domain-containing protein n=1 Tax=Metabacillus herbersteinensis TaxID=283816 RepID=A0ABV6GJ99_9BACI
MEQLIEFESLAAKKKLEGDAEFYLTVLDKALNDEANLNLAITGGYGAGKTTIIDSYFDQNGEKAKKMLRVSIATFQTEQVRSETNNEITENLLEQQILQQMFYQVNPDKIPNSKFTKISDLSFWYVFRRLIFLLTVIAFTYLTVSRGWFTKIHTYFSENIKNAFLSNSLSIVAIWLFLLLVGVSIYLLLLVFRKLGVSKFGVASTRIEFNFQDGSTVFNHYLDEIIYLFKKTDYKYIVFEDLDRFGNVTVFERLRSLNTTINNAARLKNRDIKFIYALKDDIFSNEDETELIYNRTKFFDFIIPTVKVLHGSNAESEFLKKLKGIKKIESIDISNTNQSISGNLIEDIAIFINDKRTLVNICNEFEIYRHRLKNSSITYSHLFAFIVYKNIYPKDYSDLLENRGIVHSVFQEKDQLISSLEEKIQKLHVVSSNGLGSILTEKQDLSILFIKKRNLLGKNVQFTQGHVNLSNSYLNHLNAGNQLFDFVTVSKITGEIVIKQNESLVVRFNDIDDFMTIDSVNYLDLYKEFENNKVKKQDELNSQISKLKEKIKHIRTKSISRLLIEDRIELHVDLSYKRLLHLLIRKNWLNESYEDFLTVFREGTLSANDNELMKLIKLGSVEQMLEYELKNKGKIAEKVRVDDINSIAAVNIDFIERLLVHKTEGNTEKVEKIIDVIFRDIEVNFDLLFEFLLLLKSREAISPSKNLVRDFLNLAILNEMDIWDITNNIEVTEEVKGCYATIILENATAESLLGLESIECLGTFVSQQLDVITLPETEEFYEASAILGVKFTSLEGIPEHALEKVKEINGYEINLHNLRTILNSNHVSMKLIQSEQFVYDYYKINISDFINNVILKQDVYKEEESIFIEFIQKKIDTEAINVNTIESLIEHWDGVIENLTEVKAFIALKKIYELKKFTLTWQNISYCKHVYKENSQDFDVDYILSTDGNWTELIEKSYKEVQNVYVNDDKYLDFVKTILQSKNTKNPRVKEFIDSLHYYVTLAESANISPDVVKQLVRSKVLAWDPDIYRSIDTKQLKKEYVLDTFKEAQKDLSTLIEDDELIWSFELLESLLECEMINSTRIEKYVVNRIQEIEAPEFISILDKKLIGHNAEALEIMLNDSNEIKLIKYLMYLISNDYSYVVIEVIRNHQIPWDHELYDRVKSHDVDSASHLLLGNQDKIKDIQMDQELFESLIINSDDVQLSLNTIKRSSKGIKINSQISNRIFEQLLEDSKLVLENMDKALIVKIVRYLEIGNAASFLLQFFKFDQLTRDEIFDILSKLEHPFENIKKNGKSFEISVTNENLVKLLDYFKSDLLVIYEYEELEKGYLVRNKKK